MKDSKTIRIGLLIAVLTGIGLYMAITDISDARKAAQVRAKVQEWQAEEPVRQLEKQQQEYDSKYTYGHEAGFIQGISDARTGRMAGSIDLVRNAAKAGVDSGMMKLRIERKPLWTDSEQSGWIDGYVQGYRDGVRKVFVDGR